MSDKEADIPVNEIICGDCLEVMRDWPDGCVDLVLTDPPYGIGWNTNYSRFSKGSSDKAPVKNDDKAFDPTPFLRFPVVILFGANHFAKYLPPASWLIWDKRNADGTAFLSDAEVAWWSYGHGILIKTISGQWHRATGGGAAPNTETALAHGVVSHQGKDNRVSPRPLLWFRHNLRSRQEARPEVHRH